MCDAEAKVESSSKSLILMWREPALWNGTIYSPRSLALQVKRVLIVSPLSTMLFAHLQHYYSSHVNSGILSEAID